MSHILVQPPQISTLSHFSTFDWQAVTKDQESGTPLSNIHNHLRSNGIDNDDEPQDIPPLLKHTISSISPVASGPFPVRLQSAHSAATSSEAADPPKEIYSFVKSKHEPSCVYITSTTKADSWIEKLEGPAVGFDMEWTVKFNKGEKQQPTALIQLCDHKLILLLQVGGMRVFPQKLKDILESPSREKVGVNIKSDMTKLHRDFGIRAKGLVDANQYCHHRPKCRSLEKLVSNHLGKSLLKGDERIGDWDKRLSRDQLAYASNDVYAGFELYERFQKARLSNVFRNPPRKAKEKHSFHSPEGLSSPDQAQCSEESDPIVHSPRAPSPSLLHDPEVIHEKGTRTHCKLCSAQIEVDVKLTDAEKRQLDAYHLWSSEKPSLKTMCKLLGSGKAPLLGKTVVGRVIGALKRDTLLPVDVSSLEELLNQIPKAEECKSHRKFLDDLKKDRR